jgi:hypothetical protein
MPERWVIVDDGSTDRTAGIVESYAQRSWIELIHVSTAGIEILPVKRMRLMPDSSDSVFPFDIGNLDADISFEPIT